MKFDSEDILISMHRHPISLFFNLAPSFIFFIAPLCIAVALWFSGFSIPAFDLIAPYLPLIISIYYLYILLFILMVIFDYLLDRWIVTENHIINVEQTSLFNRTIAKEEIDRIQDITIECKGILPTLFDYGDIFVQTAGEKERFEFTAISHPKKVVELVMSILEERKKLLTPTPSAV